MDAMQHGRSFGQGLRYRCWIDASSSQVVRAKNEKKPELRWRRCRRRGDFAGLEAAGLVRAVTERLALGRGAAAQGDVLLAGGQDELVAEVIDDTELRGQHQGAMLAHADGDLFVGHGVAPFVDYKPAGEVLRTRAGSEYLTRGL